MSITLIEGDAATVNAKADLILTDPPYDMSGRRLAEIIGRFDCNHLVMLTTMRQLLEFSKYAHGYTLSFDFVINAVVPKKSKNKREPNYTHQTGVYMTKGKAKSIFNRTLRKRSDVADANGYYPTIFRAPRDRMHEHGMAKNLDAITDILGCFEISSVLDPFAGSGTTGLAALELGLGCIMIEQSPSCCELIRSKFSFFGIEI